MTAKPKPSAVLFVGGVAAMARFYRELVPMAVVYEDGDHVVLEADGLQLVIHGLASETSPARDAEGRVRLREDSYLKLAFPVDSLAAARERAAALGGFLKPADREWSARGFRACDGHDPEGNIFQLREAAR